MFSSIAIRLKNIYDEHNLLKLRKYTFEVTQQLNPLVGSRLLEIGPARIKNAANSPVFARMQETYYDLSLKSVELKFEYSDLDLDPRVKPKYLGDIGRNLDTVLPSDYFDTVIAFSVLEHVPDLNQAVENISRTLKPGGILQIITPWDLRFHGPRPDCWRISDDAYRYLLESLFEDLKIKYIANSFRSLSPIGLHVEAKKRD